MQPVTPFHVVCGAVALVAGGIAFAVRKGGRLHTRAGWAFCVAMSAVGLTGAVMGPGATPPQSPVGGLMVCYFIATAWLAARRRERGPLMGERIACAAILVIAALILADGVQRVLAPANYPRIPPPAAVLALGLLCVAAGIGDLRWLRRAAPTRTQRLTRHLWRMSFGFFIATGSFFLGQQQVLPAVMRGTPLQWGLAFAPFVLMVYWLVQVRRRPPPSTRMIKEDA